jgi:hypothetical protein
MTAIKRVFMVDGKPFFPIGGEADNQSGYSNNESITAFKAVKLIHGNTLEIAVYWELIEPEEGRFDFTSIDNLIANACHYGIKLLLLWFGTWFCGGLDYTPVWVKTNLQRFQRVITDNGSENTNLSPHCPANLAADKKAFVALCRHLKVKDIRHTVIGIQVENEPGVYNSDRDYCADAQADFKSPVPAKLLSALKAAGKGSVYDAWQAEGAKKSGNWSDVFGASAGRFMNAWVIASYIDAVAKAGKAAYHLPMYINVIPSYVNAQLDIYKWFTPNVDIIGPDIYTRDFKGYESLCGIYARPDNPFFLPESVKEVTDGGKSCQPLAMFRAIADYNLIGYFFFGIEYIIDENGAVRPEFQNLVDSIGFVAAVTPLLLKYQGAGKIHAVVQEEFVRFLQLDMDGYVGMVRFGSDPAPIIYKSWRHGPGKNLFAEPPENNNRARGLIIQANRNEFYLIGCNYRLILCPSSSTAQNQRLQPLEGPLVNLKVHYLSIDEGHFDNSGEFVADLRRNGGQIASGVWMERDSGVVRVLTYE